MQSRRPKSTKSGSRKPQSARTRQDQISFGPLVRDPFPEQLHTICRYNLPTVLRTNVGNLDAFSLKINAPLAIDYTNALGYSTRVPADFSYLCANDATGPYRRYRVVGWDCKYTFTNDTNYSIDVFFQEGELSTDFDTTSELYAQSHIKRITLNRLGDSASRGVIVFSGTPDTSTPAVVDGSYEFGNYNTNPTQGIYHNFLIPQVATNIRYFVQVEVALRVIFFDRRVTRNT